MNDFELINYIKDEMLTNDHLDANFVWDVSRCAEEDSRMYKLMSEWMSTADSTIRAEIEFEMEEILSDYDSLSEDF